MATELMNLSNFTRNTLVSIKSGGGRVELCVNDVLNWLAPGAPVKEALGFLRTCQATGLDPWLREIYLIPMGNSWGTVIAKAGFLRRGMESPNYNGFESGIVIQAIDPRCKPGAGPLVGTGPIIDREGAILPDGHKLLGGWCRAWKRGEERSYYNQIAFGEFNKGTGTWKTMPCVMIRKVAISHTFREAYNMSEVYDESEVPTLTAEQYARYVDLPTRRPASIPRGEPGTIAGVRQLEALYDKSPDPHLPPAHVVEIRRLQAELKLSDAWMERTLAGKGADDLADLSIDDANKLIRWMQESLSRAEVVDNYPKVVPRGEALETFMGARSLDEEIVGNATDSTMATDQEDLMGSGVETSGAGGATIEATVGATTAASVCVGGPPDGEPDED